MNRLLLPLMVGLVLLGCSRGTYEKIAKLVDPRFPNEAATHIVQLRKVQFAGSDLNESTFGAPLDIKVTLLENGTPLPCASNNNVLAGTRGERVLKQPVQWIISFKPSNNYQIVLEEQAVIARAVKYAFPDAPKLGYWPFAEPEGRIQIGRNSYVQFSDAVAK